jgi:hypothetical protein
VTAAQLSAAFTNATNDISESALGAAKQAILQAACITDTQRNSKAMRRFNGTEDWVRQNFNAASYAWCRAEAWRVDESGEACCARIEQHCAFVEKATTNKLKRERLEAKREIAKQKLAAMVLVRNPEALRMLKSNALGNMLDKWRETDKLVVAEQGSCKY